ncbi:MAG: flippase-like domain-containing protein [Acidimicrobiia bacterium]
MIKTFSVPRASYFVFTGPEPRVRSPRDVVNVVLGALLVIWAVIAVDRIPDWASSFTDMVQAAPLWVDSTLAIGYLLSLVYALVVIGGLIFGAGKHLSALRDVFLVLVLTTGLVVLLSLWINEAWPYVLPEIGLQDATPRFPVTRVAVVTGLLLVVAPYVTRPLRRFGWIAILITAVAAIGLGYGSPIHAIGSFGIGLVAAGTIRLVFGSPRGYPAPDMVSQGLARLGVDAENLRLSAEQRWGMVRFEAEDGEGRPIEIKVHGRDAFDSQLAAKVWRTLIYKEMGRTVSFSRLQAVEHEALGTLMASRSGVSVPELRAVGRASAEIALIAFGVGGTRLADMSEGDVSDELLVSVWRQVAALHDASITHGALTTEAIRVVAGVPQLAEFDLCSLEPQEDDRAGDVVELLFSMSLLVGPERAVLAAKDGMGVEALTTTLPYIQVPAVSSASRRQVDKAKPVVTALRDTVLEVTGAEAPEPVQLRRVTWKRLLGLALLLLIFVAVVPALTQVDYAEIWDVLQSADWLLIVVAVIVGHTQFFPSATATMFAVPATLPFWPLVVLQTASQFISLAIPSSAGRVAMNAAFLHKFGVTVTVALAQGAIDGFSGFLVQVAILLVVMLTGDVDLGLQIDSSDVPWLLILGVLALLIIGVVVAVRRVKRLRERVVPILSQAWGALQVVLKQPSRAFGLLGSNFVYWNVLGLTLWILLEAVGSGINYGSALFVAAGTSLFAGFMPVPGGVGVAEAAMTALLATFGVDQSTAFAVTAVYRVITFYLPALEGMFGTRWLERNDYI